jgi:hypothetical protein
LSVLGTFLGFGTEEYSSVIFLGTDEYNKTEGHTLFSCSEVDMLTTKIGLLMKKLEDPDLDHLKMIDSHMTCEKCGETCHMGINFPTVCQDVNFIEN